MIEIKAPEPVEFHKLKQTGIKTIFLAGSIENGTAEKWQDKVADQFKNKNVVILNPRRDDWDKSWKQDISNPQFKEQVTWELNCQENCDYTFMYFDPSTKSPISLLELGLFYKKPMIVVCPNGFYRKGNIQVVCQRYNIPLFNYLDTGIVGLKQLIDNGSF